MDGNAGVLRKRVRQLLELVGLVVELAAAIVARDAEIIVGAPLAFETPALDRRVATVAHDADILSLPRLQCNRLFIFAATWSFI